MKTPQTSSLNLAQWQTDAMTTSRNTHGLLTTATQFGTLHALRILDADGNEAATVAVQDDNPLIVGAIVYNVRQSLRDGWTVDYSGESTAQMAMEVFGGD